MDDSRSSGKSRRCSAGTKGLGGRHVKARQQWLATHRREILHRTTYRTTCLLHEIERNNWHLDKLPIIANGQKSTATSYSGRPAPTRPFLPRPDSPPPLADKSACFRPADPLTQRTGGCS